MKSDEVAELVSKSLTEGLSESEQLKLDGELKDSKDSLDYFSLSSLIHDAAKSGDSNQHEELNAVSKERMRRKLAAASAASSPLPSSASQVAETPTEYFLSDEPVQTEERLASSRFTLIRKIGDGGLGTVWLARDEYLRRNVAIKEMNQTAAQSAKLWKRFQREAEITGHLEHPNVVPLYLSGVNAKTRMPFYAMRFLGKQTLSDAIRRYHLLKREGTAKSIDLHRLLNVFVDICQAIAYAHSRGVIHRDLKPENIALDNFGQVLVLDWGLAKIDTDGELATRLALSEGGIDSISVSETLDGDVVGTPLYMAPEQAAGELDSLDERTDIYGLGAILFAILTGVAPHQTSSKPGEQVTGVKGLLKFIAEADTPQAHELNESVPKDLEAICLRAMARERFARYESAQQLAAEVEAWIAGRHERQAAYEAMRLTGRDLKSRLCVQLRQLMSTAQFMVELPPIQGLLSSIGGNSEDFQSWRERLAKILEALARTKTNLNGLSYCQVDDNKIVELVRIERSRTDSGNIRAVPQSRLRKGLTNTFHKVVMQQFPGECAVDYDFMTAGSTRIVAGVPVFDSSTEEPFGLVLAESELENLAGSEISATTFKDSIFLIDEGERVVYSNQPQPAYEYVTAEQKISRWKHIKNKLETEAEYIETDREFYATRLGFPQNLNSLRIVLKVSK